MRHQNDSHQKCMQCTKTKRDNAMFFFEIKRTFRAAAFPHILACSKTNNAAKPELSMSPRCLANIMRNYYFLMRVSDFLNIIKGITFFKNYFFSQQVMQLLYCPFIMSRGYILFVWQEYSFQITMRQQWNDKRLAYKERLQGQLAGWSVLSVFSI